MKDRRGGDLLGGQQQQLAIARALITRPKVLLLDEPTEGIQPNIITQIGDVIEVLRDEGEMSIVLVEQYFDFAVRLADQFVVLNRGAVSHTSTRATLNREALLSAVSI
jgi:urea transport system ATP-binding protein